MSPELISMTHGLTWKEDLLNKASIDVNVETLPGEEYVDELMS